MRGVSAAIYDLSLWANTMSSSSRRLSAKALANLKLIVALAPDAHLASVIGKGGEIMAMMATIRNALRNPETPCEIIEAVVSDDVVNHLIDIVGADFSELTLRPADKSALLSEAIETSMEPVAAVGSVN